MRAEASRVFEEKAQKFYYSTFAVFYYCTSLETMFCKYLLNDNMSALSTYTYVWRKEFVKIQPLNYLNIIVRISGKKVLLLYGVMILFIFL